MVKVEMSRMLFISNISNKITSFVTASISAAHDMGLEFHHASNWESAKAGQIEADESAYNVKIHSLSISRSPFAWSNVKAYRDLVALIQREKIDYIHCNTPTGGVLGRIAGKKCKVKKTIYQAHGFHFYKGAPLKNWLLYYPVEKFLARYTDVLITINQEDFAFAKRKLKLRNGGKVYYVPGVGIDTTQYEIDECARVKKRRELGLGDGDIALISMGDLIRRKNYGTAIRAVAKANNPKLQYYICGEGLEEANLRALVYDLGMNEQIHFLGFRADINDLLAAADIFLFTSKQEGLPRSTMEAMASGLPCVVSKIRGNTDLIVENKGGFLCDPTDANAFAERIDILCRNNYLCQAMGEHNKIEVKEFDISVVKKALKRIYAEI